MNDYSFQSRSETKPFLFKTIFFLKDLIKKRSLEYKGRIVLENYKFEKLEDGEGCDINIFSKLLSQWAHEIILSLQLFKTVRL